MTWPLPAPGVIAGQVASVYESAPGLAGIDARSPNTIAGVNARAIEMALFDLYLFQSNLAAELMPDTAVDTLARHAGNPHAAGFMSATPPASAPPEAPWHAGLRAARAHLLPGLTLQAQYDYFDLDGETSATSDKGNVVLLRSVLAF